MLLFRRLLVVLFSTFLTISVASCDDTWRGVKEDTGENLQKTGEALEDAGEDIQN